MMAIRRFLRTAYEHVGGLIYMNLVWAVCALPWLAAAYAIAVYGTAVRGEWTPYASVVAVFLAAEFVWFAPPTALLFLACERWLEEDDIRLVSLFRQLPKFALRVQLTGFALMAATFTVVVNILFYQSMGGWLGAILSGFMAWLLLGLLLVSLYLMPLLVGTDLCVGAALRRSLIIVVRGLIRTLGLLISVTALLVLGATTGVGLFCGVLAAVALLETVWFRHSFDFRQTGSGRFAG